MLHKELILLKKSGCEIVRSKTGTWFAEKPFWRTSFPNRPFGGRAFCDFDCHRADTEFFNKISSKRTFTAKTTNVRLGEQATNRHSDLMHKSGPLSGPLLIKQQGVSIYN